MYTALVKIQMQKAEEEEERKKKGAEVEEDDEVDTSDEVVEGGAENTLEGHHSGANGIEQAAKVRMELFMSEIACVCAAASQHYCC